MVSFIPLVLPDDREALADFILEHPWPFHSGGEITREFLLQKIDEGNFSSIDVQTFWAKSDTGEARGIIKLFDLDDVEDGSPLFDLRIHSGYRGQGIGKQAVQWLTEYLFETYPVLARIEGTTRVDNIAMRKVFVSCGYAKEGHSRKSWLTNDGSKVDAITYGILREDWQSKTITPVNWND
jgi:RimJ/RimL family protein N-acetyltransferase